MLYGTINSHGTDLLRINSENNKIISQKKIFGGTLISLSELSNNVIVSNNSILTNINLATQQYRISNTNVFKDNIDFITYDLEINYGITPEYSH